MKNKIALVTGGTKGIGKAIVKKLLSLNVKVALTYAHDIQSAKKFQKELKNKEENFLILQSDISNIQNISPLYDTIENHWNAPVDFLVNNAGVLKQGNFFEIDEEEWDWIINTNLKGPFFLSQEFIKRYHNASIVNISSIGGQTGGDKAAHYAASKAALLGFTKSLARLGSKKNIRANAVAPGWIETEIFTEEQLLLLEEKAKKEILLCRLGQPHEIASSVSFLLSSDSAYITGQCLNVNGGMYFG